jgi:hypothetical protein
VQFGMITDKKMCAEPQRIIDRFAPEFEKIVLALCLLPWDRPVDPDTAQAWLFPTVPGPAAQKPAAPKRRRPKANKSAVKAKPVAVTAPETPPPVGPEANAAVVPDEAGAATEDATAAPPAKPRRVRARRSAFAAARAAE